MLPRALNPHPMQVNPELLVADLLVHKLVVAGNREYVLQELFKAVPDVRSVMVAAWDEGCGRWLLHTKDSIEPTLVKHAREIVESVWQNDLRRDEKLPVWTQRSGGMQAVAGAVIKAIHDASFNDRMDCDGTRRYLLFADGYLLDRDTHSTRKATPELVITRNSGMKFPFQAGEGWSQFLG